MSEGKQSADSLLREALGAYLDPLLKKHEESQLIFSEDLVKSNVAAEAVLAKGDPADDAMVSLKWRSTDLDSILAALELIRALFVLFSRIK